MHEAGREQFVSDVEIAAIPDRLNRPTHERLVG